MTAYYNEIDPHAAQWLRNLIAAGHIAPGDVDERSIVDVKPDDLAGYTQCHWFAGIAVWSYALRCAGWSDDRPVWTGSCPCQPFSIAGKGGGFDDKRHLWPAWFRLIRECRPVTIFGEQVASPDALAWFDHVSTDLEGAGYAVGAVDTCAAGFGAPHIRQRLYFVADTECTERRARESQGGNDHRTATGWAESADRAGERRADDELDGWQRVMFQSECDPDGDGWCQVRDCDPCECDCIGPTQEDVEYREINGILYGRMGDTEQPRLAGLSGHGGDGHQPGQLGTVETGSVAAPGPTNGFWAEADWIAGRDGKSRPVERGTAALVAGTAKGMVRSRDPGAPLNANNTAEARVMRLRGYGNAIVAPQAQAFITAYLTP